MTYSPTDPSTWSRSAASGFVLGLDLGFAQDHSALVLGGVWPQAGYAIGVIDVHQLPLGTPMNEVADQAIALARTRDARIVVDLTNNSAFAALLAARLGRNPANHMVAATITSADAHANAPTPMPISVGGMRAHVRRWSLSKAELIETIAAEIDNDTLRIAQTGDWAALQNELATLERIVRASGSVAYAAQLGKHDDLAIALGLCVFGCRRFATRSRVWRPRKERPSVAGWT